MLEINENQIKETCRELCKNRTYLAAIQDIVDITEGKKKTSIGSRRFFTIGDVNGASAPLLTKLKQASFICVARETARKKVYMLNSGIKTEWLREVINEIQLLNCPTRWRFIKIPEDLFSIIEGYEDIKYIIQKSLKSEKASSILLVGPPASGKSLFLLELERIGGTLIVAGLSTKAGIRDVLLNERPIILLIDEIEKCTNPLDLSVLLTWMETGKIVISKAKERVNTQTTTKPLVVAAANSEKRLPQELLSRFSVFHLPEYTPDEFKQITKRVLVERENTPLPLANYIASTLLEFGFKDIRDAVRVSRLSNTKEEAKHIIETMARYKKRDSLAS